MNIFNFDPNAILSIFLTMFRISIVLFLLPFFGGQSLPSQVKAALVIILTVAVWPALSFPGSMFPGSVWMILLMILGEIILGFILGMLVNIIFAAVQFGGQMLGFTMGFAMVNVMDPITGIQQAATAHFLWMCTMLTFLALGGHIYLLSALAQSFDLVPPGSLIITPELYRQVMYFSNEIFVLGVRIAAPVLAAIFLTDLSMAMIAKVAPQINILLVGLPAKIMVGFFFLGLVFTLVSDYVARFVNGMPSFFMHILDAMHQAGP